MALLGCLLYILASPIRVVKLGIPKMTDKISGYPAALLFPDRTKGASVALAAMSQSSESLHFVDIKASLFSVSRRKLKKRLIAGGLRPSRAAELIRLHGKAPFLSAALADKTLRAKRHRRRWFPFDLVLR